MKRRKRKNNGGREGYKRYVWKVLKQVHPEMGISGKAMLILNNLMNDMFERLAQEATQLSKYTGILQYIPLSHNLTTNIANYFYL